MHPLAWKYDGAECVDDRNLAMSLRVTARAQKKGTLERQSTEMHLLLRSNHKQAKIKRQHETRHCDTDLPSRAVTNRLSEVSITHDDTSRLQWFKLFRYTTRLKGY